MKTNRKGETNDEKVKRVAREYITQRNAKTIARDFIQTARWDRTAEYKSFLKSLDGLSHEDRQNEIIKYINRSGPLGAAHLEIREKETRFTLKIKTPQNPQVKL